ncbi:hypothetical protein EV715DRAFT_286786 [Schizophyllum commune]
MTLDGASVKRAGSESLFIYDNNTPGYPIYQVLDRYSSSLALMMSVFWSSHRTCMSTKSSMPLKLIYQGDRRGQFEAATLLSRAADDIDVEAVGDINHEPRAKMMIFFATRTTINTTGLVYFSRTVWRFSVSSTPFAINRHSRPGKERDAAGRGIDR